jgi:hypothetical protein
VLYVVEKSSLFCVKVHSSNLIFLTTLSLKYKCAETSYNKLVLSNIAGTTHKKACERGLDGVGNSSVVVYSA